MKNCKKNSSSTTAIVNEQNKNAHQNYSTFPIHSPLSRFSFGIGAMLVALAATSTDSNSDVIFILGLAVLGGLVCATALFFDKSKRSRSKEITYKRRGRAYNWAIDGRPGEVK